MIRALNSALLLASAIALMAQVKLTNEQIYTGLCDASAGVAAGDSLFVVADDEAATLSTYSLEKPGAPLMVKDLAAFLEVEKKSPEADIEGAAELAEMVFWISSHARNKNGKARPSRQRLFATKISTSGEVSTVGRTYKNLLGDLLAAPELKAYNLRAAASVAPKEWGGLNIEGLGAGENGSLLIGFRNPIPRGRALIVPLLNPLELIGERPVRVRFGAGRELDLAGDGIRAILGKPGDYYIVAGPFDGARRSSLWKWDGKAALERVWQAGQSDVNLEALFELPKSGGRPRFIALSDEGSTRIEGVECKELPPIKRRFRSFLVEIRP